MECNCQQITGSRIGLGVFCTKEEGDSIQLIQNRISCAAQAARPDAIPDGVDPAKAEIFIRAAIESLAQYRWMENDWWNAMKAKYELPKDKNVWVDFSTFEFYIIEG